MLLAAVPSSLMLSVTTYLSTDIAAIPLLWIVPLAIYLLTFTLVFGRRRIVPHRVWVEILPVALLPLVLVLVARANEPLALVIPTHLVAFFVAAMVCHGELAQDRPDPRHLTEFYLWISVGGVVGGAFTALVAPVVFTNVLEYPLVLSLLPLLPTRAPAAWQGRDPPGPGRPASDRPRRGDRGADRGARAAPGSARRRSGPPSAWSRFSASPSGGGPSASRWAWRCSCWRGSVYRGEEGQLLYAERSFFGVSRVTREPSGQYHMLMHGTTLHGMQALVPARRREPLTYFHRGGPLGQFFAAVDGPTPRQAVAVVGLGAGSLACYGKPHQRWTFYEIDPTVLRIAANPRYFTFLRDCPPKAFVVLGDARLTLVRAPDAAYDLIILDAYSSDAPPMHLITLDALRLYLTKLAPGGVLLFNISNRHLVLEPVLGAIARAAGLAARTRDDARVSDAERMTGKVESQWVAMARREEDLGVLRSDPLWKVPQAPPDLEPWTDNFASLLAAFRWGVRL